MEIYLVGGAVRDELLKREVKERDFVVVGASVKEMLAKGYRQVGKDFPVFLHPKTNEEYALARIERKIGRGYTGFEFDASPKVTLEEDLARRDLTINAIAKKLPEGELIDPYHGQEDLEQKILRHVSPAFVEDPVRVLRIARFAARFDTFKVAPETTQLMQQMVKSGEVDALVAERVWKELERALEENHPELFFKVLAECDALPVLFPQIALHHAQCERALIQAVKMTLDTQIRFSALLHSLSVADIQALCERYRVPSDYRELAVLVAHHLDQYRQINQLRPTDIVDLLQSVDAFRRENRFEKFLMTCMSCSLVPSDFLKKCFLAAKSIDVQAIIGDLKGKAVADRIYQERVKKVAELPLLNG
ncbi:MAG: multifunctional CCA tRNA nucleotidyl transferase/2'3'-cyclic phosphodiesterase/2'nucleotidase/phosphatase [Gammaproteobacteria bacterium]